jgi:hypothetical protein
VSFFRADFFLGIAHDVQGLYVLVPMLIRFFVTRHCVPSDLLVLLFSLQGALLSPVCAGNCKTAFWQPDFAFPAGWNR